MAIRRIAFQSWKFWIKRMVGALKWTIVERTMIDNESRNERSAVLEFHIWPTTICHPFLDRDSMRSADDNTNHTNTKSSTLWPTGCGLTVCKIFNFWLACWRARFVIQLTFDSYGFWSWWLSQNKILLKNKIL